MILNRMYKDYYLPLGLYTRLKQSIRNSNKKEMEEVNEFVDELPQKLKNEVSLFIHESVYKSIDFLKERSSFFIQWICPLLKTYYVSDNQHIYYEGDEIASMYFLKGGICGFVLPNQCNAKYIDIPLGAYFGIVDIIGCILNTENGYQKVSDWILYKSSLKRQFTVLANTHCELLSLSIIDFNRMKSEFLDDYQILFNQSFTLLYRTLQIKMQAIKTCRKMEHNHIEDEKDGHL